MASAMFCPCETRTSTCRNFATISSGLCCFLGILVLLDAKRHTSGRTTSKGEDQIEARTENVAALSCEIAQDTLALVVSWFALRLPTTGLLQDQCARAPVHRLRASQAEYSRPIYEGSCQPGC